MKDRQSCIVTITDGISPTSMPFNEFILYRLKHYPDEKQILIQVFEKGVDKNVEIPKDVSFYSLGMSILKVYKTIKCIEQEYDVKAYHIHEGKSVILFSVATFWKYRNKSIYTLHSTYKNYPFHNKLFSFCASLLARDIVCVSKTSYKYYPNILKSLRGRHAMYIQNGVDIERIDAVDIENKRNPDVFTMVYVARLIPLKRHNIIINAIENVSNVRLKLIGQGPLKEQLANDAKRLGVRDKIEFVGLLPREEVYRALKNADLYVSTSSYEGLPIGVLEAMGCGISCLVSDIEQHAEIAEKCPSLLLCSDNVNDWFKQIDNLKEMSYQERRNLGKMNKKGANDFFSLASMHAQYDELYFKE